MQNGGSRNAGGICGGRREQQAGNPDPSDPEKRRCRQVHPGRNQAENETPGRETIQQAGMTRRHPAATNDPGGSRRAGRGARSAGSSGRTAGSAFRRNSRQADQSAGRHGRQNVAERKIHSRQAPGSGNPETFQAGNPASKRGRFAGGRTKRQPRQWQQKPIQ